MKIITFDRFINESHSFNENELGSIQYVYFNGDDAGTMGRAYMNVRDLCHEVFEVDMHSNIEYLGYNSVDDVIDAVEMLKPGEKMVLTSCTIENGISKWYYELIGRLG